MRHRSGTYWKQMDRCADRKVVNREPCHTLRNSFELACWRSLTLSNPCQHLTLKSARKVKVRERKRLRQNQVSWRVSCVQRLTYRSELGALVAVHRQRDGSTTYHSTSSSARTLRLVKRVRRYLCMVDHVCGAVFEVLMSKAVNDHLIKVSVASVANWSRTDINLKSDGEPSCKAFRSDFGNARSASDNRAEQSCWKPWQNWSGRAHDPGSDGSHPMPGNHNQVNESLAAWSEPSDLGLSQVCGLASRAVPK